MKRLFSPFLLIFLFFIHFHPISGQSPAAAPAPPGPDNLTAILEKDRQFTTFIRLLLSTKVGDQIYTQLNNSNQGLTIFAPTDNSFSNLKPGTLNSFTDQQKVELTQFHVIPAFLSPSQFQTASNPLRTQAGGSEGQFTLNVTSGSSAASTELFHASATGFCTIKAQQRCCIARWFIGFRWRQSIRFFWGNLPVGIPVSCNLQYNASFDCIFLMGMSAVGG